MERIGCGPVRLKSPQEESSATCFRMETCCYFSRQRVDTEKIIISHYPSAYHQ